MVGLLLIGIKSLDLTPETRTGLLYQTDSFGGVVNIYSNLITCESDIFIPLILQSYI